MGVEYLDTIICNYQDHSIIEKQVSPFTISGPSLGKAKVCKPVLGMLPNWFGKVEANQNYLGIIDQLPTFLAQDEDQIVGCLSIKQHFSRVAKINIMGVLPEYHRWNWSGSSIVCGKISKEQCGDVFTGKDT
jgi:hypothetical protein